MKYSKTRYFNLQDEWNYFGKRVFSPNTFLSGFKVERVYYFDAKSDEGRINLILYIRNLADLITLQEVQLSDYHNVRFLSKRSNCTHSDQAQAKGKSGSNAKQKLCNLGKNAAAEAKEAKDAQGIASSKAMHQVKTLLAEKAEAAAKTAQADYLGKRNVVATLKEKLKQVNIIVQEESENLIQEKEVCATADAVAKAAKEEVTKLDTVIKCAQQICNSTSTIVKSISENVVNLEKAAQATNTKIERLEKRIKETECGGNKKN
ncbi:hypothetical protein FQA39_LY00515 [Lamprigera yunnana]|nr:hypothetical protein FQA39_LY00515 [Lamprigera yunnana]